MKQRVCDGETREFTALKKQKKTLLRHRGIFIAAFLITLVIAAAVLSVMVIDYRGRVIARGDVGRIFDFSFTDNNTVLLTLFGYDFFIDRVLLENIGNRLYRIGEYVYNSIPLFLRLTIEKIPYYFNLLCGLLCEMFLLIN